LLIFFDVAVSAIAYVLLTKFFGTSGKVGFLVVLVVLILTNYYFLKLRAGGMIKKKDSDARDAH
jgi:hypothetical protein